MRRYETISIIRPAVGDEEIEAINQRSISIIEGDGGTIVKADNWGLKPLAYLIKKEQQGYYVYMDYGATHAAVTETAYFSTIEYFFLFHAVVILFLN